jgi:hypothetical protein
MTDLPLKIAIINWQWSGNSFSISDATSADLNLLAHFTNASHGLTLAEYFYKRLIAKNIPFFSLQNYSDLDFDRATRRERTPVRDRQGVERQNSKMDDFQVKKVVGVIGFEPTTTCSQSRYATRLRYTPI